MNTPAYDPRTLTPSSIDEITQSLREQLTASGMKVLPDEAYRELAEHVAAATRLLRGEPDPPPEPSTAAAVTNPAPGRYSSWCQSCQDGVVATTRDRAEAQHWTDEHNRESRPDVHIHSFPPRFGLKARYFPKRRCRGCGAKVSPSRG